MANYAHYSREEREQEKSEWRSLRRQHRKIIRSIAQVPDPVSSATRLQEWTKGGLSWDEICWETEKLVHDFAEDVRDSIRYLDGESGLRRETHAGLYYLCWDNLVGFRRDVEVIRHNKRGVALGVISKGDFFNIAARRLDPHMESVLYFPHSYIAGHTKSGMPIVRDEFRATFVAEAIDEVWARHMSHREDEIEQHQETRTLAEQMPKLAEDLELEAGWNTYNILEALTG